MFGLHDIYSGYTQSFPPKPSFTEDSILDLTGKVYIVTGSNSGVGKEVASVLFAKNATVYVAARSEDKASAAIAEIQNLYPDSKGKLVFLSLDLADLSGIKSTAETFLAAESRLDVLFNNAGVMKPPYGSTSKQGYELQIAVNNLGPFLLTQLLTPILTSTATTAPAGSVRIVWASSYAAVMPSSPSGGMDVGKLDSQKEASSMSSYITSKTGNYYFATEYAKRNKELGIVSSAVNPGLLDSDLWRDFPGVFRKFIRSFLLRKPIFGAYTELYAGLSPELNDKSGSWIIPWGRPASIRKDLEAGSKAENEGGSGIAGKFWDWSEQQVKPFM